MSDSVNNIWNDDDGESTPKRVSSGRRLRSFILFFIVLALVLAAVLIAAYRDGTGFDVLRRQINYGAESGRIMYDYDADTTNHFAALDDCLVVLSGSSLRLLNGTGELWSVNVNMSNPMLSCRENRAVAYDVGGRQLFVLDQEGEVTSMEAGTDECYVSASLNKTGMLAVTMEKKGSKGSVSVYNADMELVFAFNSSRRFLTDACVSDDGKNLAVVTMGQDGGVFVSNIVLYDLTQEDPIANYDVSDGLTVCVGSQGNHFIAVCDTCLTAAKTNGTVLGTYSYGGSYLREYDVSGNGFTALLLNRYTSGNAGMLITVDEDGKAIASLNVDDEVRSISAAGRYLAVLYTDDLVVYNEDLKTYASLHGTNCNRVLMRKDGSVLMLGTDSAELYLP